MSEEGGLMCEGKVRTLLLCGVTIGMGEVIGMIEVK